MENPVTWLYLKVISGALVELIQLYFTQWSHYHTALRSAAMAILFTGGLAWMGFLIARTPVDRGKSAVGAFLTIAACGILLSTSSNSNNMYTGGGAGAPVANGTYWSYTIVGNFYQIFKSSIDSVYDATLTSVVAGTAGPRDRNMAIAYESQARNNAKLFEDSPVHDIYLDYATLCTNAAMKHITDQDQIKKLQAVGLFGGTQIGVLDEERSILSSANANAGQVQLSTSKSVQDLMAIKQAGAAGKFLAEAAGDAIGGIAGIGGLLSGGFNGYLTNDKRDEGLEVLRTLSIPDVNPYDGKKLSYNNPTKAYWDKRKGLTTTGPEFNTATTHLGGRMLQSGLDPTAAASPPLVVPITSTPAQKFYPKNCEEAFLLAEDSIKSWRLSNINDPNYGGDLVVGAMGSLNAQKQMYERTNEIVKQRLKAAGAKEGQSELLDNVNASGDTLYDWMIDLTSAISEWMLRFKIPMTIATCAMLAAALLVAFPLFCVMSVFMGYSILWTYLKLLVLAFLVVFLNDLFLGMASDLLASNMLAAGQKVGYLPGAGSLAADLSAATSKAIIFTSLTVIEIAVAKLLIWDDVKSLGSFNPSSVGIDSASKGLQIAGSIALGAAALATGGAAAVGTVTAKSGAAAAAKGAAGRAAMGSAARHFGNAASHAISVGSRSGSSGGGGGSSARFSGLTPSKPKSYNQSPPVKADSQYKPGETVMGHPQKPTPD